MSRPLRILVAHNVRRDRPGGMSRIMERIHREVAGAGHQVEYFCAEDAPPAARGRWGRLLFPQAVRRHAARAAARGQPYDVVNVHEASGAAITGSPPPGTRVMVTSHGVEHRAWELALEERRLGRGGPGWKTRLIYPLTALWQADASLRRAGHVFCLNEEDRAYLTRRFGVAPARITRIFPGADARFGAEAAGRDYGRAERLLFAGTWRKNKGIEDLVPAFSTLVQRHPLLELVVLGGGVPAGTIAAAFPAILQPRIHCVETRDDAETARVFAGADLFLLPSLLEGTPLTLMEAMFSGLPVVTTDTCGMRDVIRHGENGLLVPIRSPGAIVAAVERLLASPEERARLGRAAHAEATERYTWPRVAVPVREVYERAAGSPA